MARLPIREIATRIRHRLDNTGRFDSLSETVWVDDATGGTVIVIRGDGKEFNEQNEVATVVWTATSPTLDEQEADDRADAVIDDFKSRDDLIRP